MKYTLKITARHYDANGNYQKRVNELPIPEETAFSLKDSYSKVFPCPIKAEGSSNIDIDVAILKDGEIICGWRGM